MAIESEMLADAGKAGLRIKEVEIAVRYDVDGSTKNPIQHGFEVLVIDFKRYGVQQASLLFYSPWHVSWNSRPLYGSPFLANLFLGWKSKLWTYYAYGSVNCCREFYGSNRHTAAFVVCNFEECEGSLTV